VALARGELLQPRRAPAPASASARASGSASTTGCAGRGATAGPAAPPAPSRSATRSTWRAGWSSRLRVWPCASRPRWPAAGGGGRRSPGAPRRDMVLALDRPPLGRGGSRLPGPLRHRGQLARMVRVTRGVPATVAPLRCPPGMHRHAGHPRRHPAGGGGAMAAPGVGGVVRAGRGADHMLSRPSASTRGPYCTGRVTCGGQGAAGRCSPQGQQTCAARCAVTTSAGGATSRRVWPAWPGCPPDRWPVAEGDCGGRRRAAPPMPRRARSGPRSARPAAGARRRPRQDPRRRGRHARRASGAE
jgi:hypothetical protein